MSTMYLTQFETSSFTFLVLTETPEAGREALEEAWEAHAAETGADPTYLSDYGSDIVTVEVEEGVVLRDWEPLRRRVL